METAGNASRAFAPSEPKVGAIVLNWNGAGILGRCLDAFSHQDYPNLIVIVVDNGSVDGSIELVRSSSRNTILIENGRNIGTSGRNPALSKALELGCEYMFVTDNDLIINTDTVRRLVWFLENHSEVGIAGPSFYNTNRGGKAPLARVSKRTAGVELYEYVDEPTETECIGAAMVRRSVVEKIGFYDPAYFAYQEDVDFCVRARRAGFKVYILPNVVVAHEAGYSVKKIRGLRGFVSIRGRCIFAGKEFHGVDKIRFLAFMPLQVLTTGWRWFREGESYEFILMLLGVLSGLGYLLLGREPAIFKKASLRLMNNEIHL